MGLSLEKDLVHRSVPYVESDGVWPLPPLGCEAVQEPGQRDVMEIVRSTGICLLPPPLYTSTPRGDSHQKSRRTVKAMTPVLMYRVFCDCDMNVSFILIKYGSKIPCLGFLVS